jgi:uncharacterized protein
VKKRQGKSPKVYIRDNGLLHFLLGIYSIPMLRAHPRYGASWEGFALEQTLANFGEQDAFFWSTLRGAELACSYCGGGADMALSLRAQMPHP